MGLLAQGAEFAGFAAGIKASFKVGQLQLLLCVQGCLMDIANVCQPLRSLCVCSLSSRLGGFRWTLVQNRFPWVWLVNYRRLNLVLTFCPDWSFACLHCSNLSFCINVAHLAYIQCLVFGAQTRIFSKSTLPAVMFFLMPILIMREGFCAFIPSCKLTLWLSYCWFICQQNYTKMTNLICIQLGGGMWQGSTRSPLNLGAHQAQLYMLVHH